MQSLAEHCTASCSPDAQFNLIVSTHESTEGAADLEVCAIVHLTAASAIRILAALAASTLNDTGMPASKSESSSLAISFLCSVEHAKPDCVKHTPAA